MWNKLYSKSIHCDLLPGIRHRLSQNNLVHHLSICMYMEELSILRLSWSQVL